VVRRQPRHLRDATMGRRWLAEPTAVNRNVGTSGACVTPELSPYCSSRAGVARRCRRRRRHSPSRRRTDISGGLGRHGAVQVGTVAPAGAHGLDLDVDVDAAWLRAREDEPAVSGLPDQRPGRHVRNDPSPEGDRGGGQRGQRFAQPGGFGRQAGQDVTVDPGDTPDRFRRAASRHGRGRARRIQRRTVDTGRLRPAAMRRYPAPRVLACRAAPITAVVSARRAPPRPAAGRGWYGRPGTGRGRGRRTSVAVPCSRSGLGVSPRLQRAGTSWAGQHPARSVTAWTVSAMPIIAAGSGLGAPAWSTTPRGGRGRRGRVSGLRAGRCGAGSHDDDLRRGPGWPDAGDMLVRRHDVGAGERSGRGAYVGISSGGNRAPARHPRWRSTGGRHRRERNACSASGSPRST
jgi:hypothetical protein